MINNFALAHNLYFSVSWIDTLTHSIGGAIIAGIVFYLIDLRGRLINGSTKTVIKRSGTIIIGTVFFVGIVWELFELKTGFNNYIY